MEKIYLVIQESNVDGELFFNAVPCASLEIARKVMQKEKEEILKEYRYKGFEECPEDYQFEEDEDSVYINILDDDYYEDIHIEEKEMVTE